MSDPNALPIAGWYPDPENEAGDRWWNGVSWSDHRRPRNVPAAPPAPPAPVTPVPVPPVPVPPVASVAPAVAVRPNPYAGSAQSTVPQPYAPAPAATAPNRNPLALAGMITSLVAILCNFILFGAPGIAGAILSFFGLRRANQLIREGVAVGNGRAFATIGIVAGLVGAFLWDLFYFAVFVFSSR